MHSIFIFFLSIFVVILGTFFSVQAAPKEIHIIDLSGVDHSGDNNDGMQAPQTPPEGYQPNGDGLGGRDGGDALPARDGGNAGEVILDFGKLQKVGPLFGPKTDGIIFSGQSRQDPNSPWQKMRGVW